jgi:hypothetical protein
VYMSRVKGPSNSRGLQIASDLTTVIYWSGPANVRWIATGACASSVAFQRPIERLQGPFDAIRPSISLPPTGDLASAAASLRGSAMGLVGLLSAPLLQGVPQGPWWACLPPEDSGSVLLSRKGLFRAARGPPCRRADSVWIRQFCCSVATRQSAGQPACLRKGQGRAWSGRWHSHGAQAYFCLPVGLSGSWGGLDCRWGL